MRRVRDAPALHAASGLRQWGVVFATVFITLHLPFLPASLEDLDSLTFALGLHRFDVVQHQPHPPGYPLYVAFGGMAHVLTVISGCESSNASSGRFPSEAQHRAAEGRVEVPDP